MLVNDKTNRQTPFIHLFKSRYYFYLYDVNTNSVIKIDESVYDYLKERKGSVQADEETMHIIQSLKDAGYLKSKRPLRMVNSSIKDLEYLLNHRLEHLTLQVTQQCNFKCSYCSYSYSENDTNRSHSDEKMTWDTAKRAIDFFADRIRDSKDVHIGFYGGEPLLEYELLQECMEYAKKVIQGKALTFGMTTNASLLNSQNLKYLVDNNTNILVSLDGPKEIHDKNRKLAATGEGTFDLVYGNLNKLKASMPEYYDKLSFNSVLDPSNQYSCLNTFFSCEGMESSKVQTHIVDPVLGTAVYFSDDFLINYRYQQFLGLLSYAGIKRLDVQSASPIALNNEGSLKSFAEKFITVSEVPDETGHSGPCVPGAKRLFVNTNGRFYPCEKACETSPHMMIGDLDHGFHVENITKQLNISKVTEDKCRNCWCLYKCTICANTADNGEGFTNEFISTKCADIKASTDGMFKDYVAAMEAGEILKSQNIKKEVYANA